MTITIEYDHKRHAWALTMYGKRYVFDTLRELWAFAEPEIEHEADS